MYNRKILNVKCKSDEKGTRSQVLVSRHFAHNA